MLSLLYRFHGTNMVSLTRGKQRSENVLIREACFTHSVHPHRNWKVEREKKTVLWDHHYHLIWQQIACIIYVAVKCWRARCLEWSDCNNVATLPSIFCFWCNSYSTKIGYPFPLQVPAIYLIHARLHNPTYFSTFTCGSIFGAQGGPNNKEYKITAFWANRLRRNYMTLLLTNKKCH